MEVNFNIFSLKVNGIESSAAMNVGTNLLVGFGSATKNVQGSGHINGDDGHLPADINYVDDRDVWDAPNFEVGTGHQVTSWLPEADGDAENPAQV